MKRTLQLALALALGTSMALQAGSALIKAATNGDLTSIHEKLKDGEKVNDVDSNGWSALMWAVYYRQSSAVDLLLENGADPNSQSTDSRKSYARGTTALIIAANDCQEDLVKALLQKNSRKELADAAGLTAEACARRNECPTVLRALGLKAAGSSALDAILKEIEAGKSVNAPDANGWTPLMQAVLANDLPTTELLLQKGADTNLQSTALVKPYSAGTTALIIAAQGGLDDQAMALLKKNAKPDLMDTDGKTAADHARKGKYVTTLGVLGACIDPDMDVLIQNIKAGKRSVNAPGNNGWTTLMYAVFNQDLTATRILLDLGADPNIQSTDASALKIDRDYIPKGTTALIIASRLNQGELATLLVRKNANSKLADDKGGNAIAYALEADAWEVQNSLLDRTALKKTYARLAMAEFEASKKISRSYAGELSQSQSKALAALNESHGFERMEAASTGKAYDAATLLVQVEFTKFDIPSLFGRPNARFTVRLVDGATGHLEREQPFSLTTGYWPNESSRRNGRFVAEIGAIVAEYALLAAGKAQAPSERMVPEVSTAWTGQVGFSFLGPVLSFREDSIWQKVEQMAEYPTCHEAGFALTALRNQRLAVWPINSTDLDPDIEGTVISEYGSQNKFQAAFSDRLSVRCLRLASTNSLGSNVIPALLAEGEARQWLNTKRILPWADSRLLAKTQLGAGFEALSGHPQLQGVRYLVVPHRMQLARITVFHAGNGPMNPGYASSTTKSSLGLAVIDLARNCVVWNGAFTSSASSDWMTTKALHENEDAILEQVEKALRGGN